MQGTIQLIVSPSRLSSMTCGIVVMGLKLEHSVKSFPFCLLSGLMLVPCVT